MEGRSEPRIALPHDRLDPSERRRVALAAAAPVGLVALVLTPFALFAAAGVGSVVGAAVVYGGLLGLATGFVMVDRLQSRQCPACRSRRAPGAADGVCAECGYDLVTRPRFACERRHTVHLDPGLCACGLRLRQLPVARGIGPEIIVILKAGGWLLAFLVGMGLLFQLAG